MLGLVSEQLLGYVVPSATHTSHCLLHSHSPQKSTNDNVFNKLYIFYGQQFEA